MIEAKQGYFKWVCVCDTPGELSDFHEQNCIAASSQLFLWQFLLSHICFLSAWGGGGGVSWLLLSGFDSSWHSSFTQPNPHHNKWSYSRQSNGVYQCYMGPLEFIFSCPFYFSVFISLAAVHNSYRSHFLRSWPVSLSVYFYFIIYHYFSIWGVGWSGALFLIYICIFPFFSSTPFPSPGRREGVKRLFLYTKSDVLWNNDLEGGGGIHKRWNLSSALASFLLTVYSPLFIFALSNGLFSLLGIFIKNTVAFACSAALCFQVKLPLWEWII